MTKTFKPVEYFSRFRLILALGEFALVKRCFNGFEQLAFFRDFFLNEVHSYERALPVFNGGLVV